MNINGKWLNEGCSLQLNAVLKIEDNHYTIEIENLKRYSGEKKQLNIETRLGNVERKIILEDNSIFTTKDNDLIDKIFEKKLINTLESKLILVFIAITVSIFFAFGFFKWVVPFLSKEIAHSLPAKTNKLISTNALDILDKHMFKKSKLVEKQKQDIRRHFHTKIVPLVKMDNSVRYKLHFRLYKEANVSIPNAMALPSGDIILTDKFVQLCKNQAEMDSILLHEIGHIVNRHSLQMIIRSTFISVAVMTILGDSNGLADMGVGLGSLIISSSYSRDNEAEADTYSFKHMLIGGIDPISFSNIMSRMDEYIKISLASEKEIDYLEYISSHPKTQQRIDISSQYSKCFKSGLVECKIIKKVEEDN